MWFTTGCLTSTTAWLLRSVLGVGPGIDVANVILNGLFTTVTIGIATIGFASLTDRRRQMMVLSAQRERLIALRSQAESRALQRSEELQQIIARIVTPEIDRLRSIVSTLGMNPGLDRLRQIQDDISAYSNTMVRRISHDMSPAGDPVDPEPTPILSTWRDSARLAASAQVSAPLTAIAALLLYLSQFNLGCVGIPFLAVMAFLLVTVGVGLLGRLEMLARSPISLIWLVMSALLGFAAYRFVLDSGPQQCTWATTWWESSIATVTAVTVFIGLTIVVQSSRQAARMIRDLETTNQEIAEVTQEFNVAGALTQEQISQILHGPVQGRLAAAVMALRIHMDEVEKGGTPSTQVLQQRIGELLDEAAGDLVALAEIPRERPGDATEILSDLSIRWRGFLDIDIAIHESAQRFLTEHRDWVPRVTQCIDEALTNSSRHGFARNVHVDLSLDGVAFLSLTVIDDGRGVAQPPHQGLGLASITSTGGTWQLSSQPLGGARLHVQWPLP
jgi:signal transduction histidine kinase